MALIIVKLLAGGYSQGIRSQNWQDSRVFGSIRYRQATRRKMRFNFQQQSRTQNLECLGLWSCAINTLLS